MIKICISKLPVIGLKIHCTHHAPEINPTPSASLCAVSSNRALRLVHALHSVKICVRLLPNRIAHDLGVGRGTCTSRKSESAINSCTMCKVRRTQDEGCPKQINRRPVESARNSSKESRHFHQRKETSRVNISCGTY